MLTNILFLFIPFVTVYNVGAQKEDEDGEDGRERRDKNV